MNTRNQRLCLVIGVLMAAILSAPGAAQHKTTDVTKIAEPVGQTIGPARNTGDPSTGPNSASGGIDVLVRGETRLVLTPNVKLSLGGDLVNQGIITTSTGSAVIFNGGGAQSATGVTSFADLTKTGGGILTLNDPIRVNGTLILANGVVTTGSNKITVANSDSGAVVITSGSVNGEVVRAIAAGSRGTYMFTDFNTRLIPDGSQGAIQVSVKSFPNTTPPNIGSGVAVKRYYTITPTGLLTATLRLAYQDGEINGIPEASMTLFRSPGVPWVLVPSTPAPLNNYVETASPVSQFSQWTIGDVTRPLSFTQAMSAGWNMIALPSNVTNGYYLSLYPSAIPGTLYSFNGSYVSRDTMQLTAGYWLSFPSAAMAVDNGFPVTSAPLSLASGWNMIGGLSCAVPISSVSDPGGIIIAGTLYGFNGSYVSSDTIQRGKGYWICTRAAGTIGLACGSGMAKKNARQDLAAFPTLTIRDASGMGRTLSWDVVLDDTTAKHSFRLPPLSPVGTFDVRFTDDMSMSQNAHGTIAIQATAYPLTVTPAHLPSGSEAQYTLTEVMGSACGETYTLTNNTAVTIVRREVTSLRLGKVMAEPLVFALHQNYPNPFNPSTTIRYGLPHNSLVTLTVYNTLGQQVAQLVNEQQQAGYHDVVFRGDGLSTGVYFYSIQIGDFSATQKLLLLK